MKAKHVILIGFVLFLVPLFHLQAQIPRTLSYQGMLIDDTGSPKPDSTYTFTFQLYNSESGGSPIWTEIEDLPVEQGLFYTVLGDPTPFADSLRFDQPYWLGIKVGDEPELSPRISLTSVGYSFYSLRADTAQYVIHAPAPTGPAGGDLTGAYPDPIINASAVTSSKIADAAVTTAKIDPSEAESGQILMYDGQNVVWQIPPSSGGDITEVTAGSGLSGGGTSGSVTLSVATSGITTAMLADSIVTPAKIDATAATGGQALMYDGTQVVWQTPPVSDGDITQVIAGAGLIGGGPSGSVTLSVADEGVVNTMLAANAVTSGKILDGTIQQVDVAATFKAPYADTSDYALAAPPGGNAGGDLTGTYPDPTLADGSVTGAKILDGTIQQVDVAATFKAPYADTSNYALAAPPGGSAGGDLTGTYPNPTIADGSVTGAKIQDLTVGTIDLADLSVTQAKLAADVSMPLSGSAGGDLTGTYPNPTITDGAVSTTKLGDNAVTSGKIADGTIQRGDVAAIFKAPYADTSDYALAAPPDGNAGGDLAGTYPDPTLADGSVTSAKIADGTITGADINATTDVSVASLTASGTITANTFVGDGSGLTGLPSGAGDGHSLDAADDDPTDVVFVDNVGNVGIGTTSPGAKLHVNQLDAGDIVDIQNSGASVLKIYNNGIVDMPKQSSCRVWANDNLLPSATWTKIQFATENWDMQDEFDSSDNYCFTAKQAGIYSVKVQVVHQGKTSYIKYGVAVYKNGVPVALDEYYYKSIYSEVPGLAVTDDVKLNAGDTIEIYGYQETGIERGVVSDSTQSYLAIHKVL